MSRWLYDVNNHQKTYQWHPVIIIHNRWRLCLHRNEFIRNTYAIYNNQRLPEIFYTVRTDTVAASLWIVLHALIHYSIEFSTINLRQFNQFLQVNKIPSKHNAHHSWAAHKNKQNSHEIIKKKKQFSFLSQVIRLALDHYMVI